MSVTYGRTTYSAADISAVIQHSLVGQKEIKGLGFVSITWAYDDDNVTSELGADGNVQMSAIASHRGKITIVLLQTSDANVWLRNYANAMDNADFSQKCTGQIHVKEPFSGGATMTAVNCALIKRPDHKDEANGADLTWVFQSANITES